MTKLYVQPAKPGLLVAFYPHRPGHYIGVRHATAADREGGVEIVAEAFGGHAYVKSEPAFALVDDKHGHYRRLIITGDLVEISAAQAEAEIAAIAKRHADAAEEAKPVADDAAELTPVLETAAPVAGEETPS